MATNMTSSEQNFKSNANGERSPMEVVTFKEARIGAVATDSRDRWRDDRVISEYIYNRCYDSPTKNIF